MKKMSTMALWIGFSFMGMGAFSTASATHYENWAAKFPNLTGDKDTEMEIKLENNPEANITFKDPATNRDIAIKKNA